MIDVLKVKEAICKEFPDLVIDMSQINSSIKYDIIQTVIDNKISFRNIYNGGNFKSMTNEELIDNLSKTIVIQIYGYKKLDRIQIIKDSKTITYLDMMNPESYHKLTEKELEKKIKEYDIKEEEIKILTK